MSNFAHKLYVRANVSHAWPCNHRLIAYLMAQLIDTLNSHKCYAFRQRYMSSVDTIHGRGTIALTAFINLMFASLIRDVLKGRKFGRRGPTPP